MYTSEIGRKENENKEQSGGRRKKDTVVGDSPL
jgi:hypothetical protein